MKVIKEENRIYAQKEATFNEKEVVFKKQFVDKEWMKKILEEN